MLPYWRGNRLRQHAGGAVQVDSRMLARRMPPAVTSSYAGPQRGAIIQRLCLRYADQIDLWRIRSTIR